MKKNAIDQTLILTTGWSDAFAPVLKEVLKRTGTMGLPVMLEVDLDLAVKAIKTGLISSVVVVAGARKNNVLLSAKQAYDRIKRFKQLRDVTVIDGWIWRGIPKKKMVLLNPAELIETVIRCINAY